ncbi:MAG: tRNA-binding protein [Gammaproteobacteria bacterium]|nr:tRNA-binding protein [Gammaproteobacteria bacterium]
MKNTVDVQDFLKLSICTGTVMSASLNEKAREPAYVMKIDFGPELGVKTTSAQITDQYTTEGLVGKQIVAVTNFPPLRVAGVKSEVLVLGAVTDLGVVLLATDNEVPNGTSIS